MGDDPKARKRMISAKAIAECASELHKKGIKPQEIIADRDGIRVIFRSNQQSKQSAADQWIEDNG